MRRVEVVSLIYRSVEFSRFISDQLARFARAEGFDVRGRLIANDPEVPAEELLAPARAAGLRTDVYRDAKPGDYYLNRVYRCWNWAVASAAADLVCLVNSDMAFSPGWLEPLLRLHDEGCTPTSRLVESGRLRTGRHGIEKDWGRRPAEFAEAAWLEYARDISAPAVVEDEDLFMPVVFDKAIFAEAGGYPEGNIYRDGVGTRSGNVLQSGDAYFFDRLADLGRPHATAFDSLVYHMQEGEMRS